MSTDQKDKTEEKQGNNIMNYGQMDFGKYTNIFFDNILMSKIGGIMDSSFELSSGNIMKMLLLLSANDLKNVLASVIKNIFYVLKQSPGYAFNAVLSIIGFLRRRRELQQALIESKKKSDKKGEQNPLDLEHIIVLDVDLVFINAFYQFITNNSICTYDNILTDINVLNTRENIYSKEFRNITIRNDDYVIKILGDLTLGINMNKNEVVKIRMNNSIIKEVKNAKSFVDLLDLEQKSIILNIKNALYEMHGPTSRNVLSYIYEKSGDTTIETSIKHFSEHTIHKLLDNKYKFEDKDSSFIELEIFVCVLYKYLGIATISRSFDELKKYKKMFIEPSSKYIVDSSYETESSHANEFGKILQDNIISKIKIPSDDIYRTFSVFKNTVGIKEATSSSEKISFSLSISSLSTNIVDASIIASVFMENIYKSYKKLTKKIGIYNIKFVVSEEVTEIDNEEYKSWEMKKKIVENVTSGYSNNDLTAFINAPIPPKTIKKIIEKKKLSCNKINEIEKDIDTLYLRESDKVLMMTALDQFKNKKDVLKDLGLQNKLNILLYGEPGTGKSTSIQAAATFLQKDIYYIDLKGIKLNDDLQKIFDYVNKNVQNGGIIVMEDIDAMTDIVLERTEKYQEKIKNYSVNDLSDEKNQSLTLEYLLNILQGTLTVDDSVFIVTTNHISHLDKAFYRDGRFDVKIELKLCDHYQMNLIYNKMMGRNIPQSLLERIPIDTYSPASLIYHIKNYFTIKETNDEIILEKFIKNSSQNESD